MMDSKNYVYSGYQTGDDFSIVSIEPGSPAEKAGMLVGDVMVSSDGVEMSNTKELSKRVRPVEGQVREFVVNRNGEEMNLQLTYEGLTDKDRSLNLAGNIIGFLFVLIGLWVLFKKTTALTQAFALFSLCFGFIFLNGPNISPGFLENLINSLSTTIVVFSFAFLLSFILQYPPESKKFKGLMLPALLAALLVWVLNFAQPESTGTLNMSVRLFFGAVIIFYFLASLITLIRKFSRSSAEERTKHGLNLMLMGAIIGLVPILIYFTASYFSPGINLPGNDYVFITFVAIPICFAMALNKEHPKLTED